MNRFLASIAIRLCGVIGAAMAMLLRRLAARIAARQGAALESVIGWAQQGRRMLGMIATRVRTALGSVIGVAGLVQVMAAGAAGAAATATTGILCSVINPPVVVVDPGRLTGVLAVERAPTAFGQPAQFILNVVNSGGATVTGLTASLRTDGAAGIGTPQPGLIATVTPGGSVAFTWTVQPGDSGALTFLATADGFTLSGTGSVPVSSAAVSAVLPGIPTTGRTESYVFPSPARDTARIAYTMASSGTVTIRVYSAGGVLVATLEETQAAGQRFSTLTTSRLARGVYFYLLERRYDSGAFDRIGPRKFMVAR